MATVTTPALVKALREKTGLGMMECKKALDQNDGDLEKATLELRKKGLTRADSKSSRAVNEGVIGSYIHMQGKIGVLIEINCETDFVAKNDNFRDFVKDVTLHIAAASPLCVSPADVPADRLEREREVAAAQVVGKPEAIIEKIVTGKIDKFFSDVCLLKQPFVKNPDITVEELLKSKIHELGENIVVRRFTRYQVGEEI